MVFAQLGPAQSDNTPYDQFPGVHFSDKPSYHDNFPDWAKMLYTFPVNYEEVVNAYELAGQIPDEWSAVERYFKNWRRAVLPFVRPDGSIALPDFESYYSKLRETQLRPHSSTARASNQSTFWWPKDTFWLNE